MNLVDYVLIVLCGIFVFRSAISGFLAEVVSLLSFIISTLLAFYFGEIFLDDYLATVAFPIVGKLLGYGIIFLLILFITSKIGNMLIKRIHFSGSLNIILGIIIGFMKGSVVVLCVVVVFNYLVVQENSPKIVKNSVVKQKIDKVINIYILSSG